MMNDFRLDLQRFDGVWKIGDEIYSAFTEALPVISSNTTITLMTDVSETTSGTIPSNVIIDLGGNTYTITDGTLTLKDGIIFKNGRLNITGGTFAGELLAGDEMTISITGGTFDSDISAYLAENYFLSQSGDIYIVFSESEFPSIEVFDVQAAVASDITVSPTVSEVITIGGESVTLRGGTFNDINVNVLENGAGAVVSLSESSESFYVNNVRYSLGSVGKDGIVVTIGSGSAVTIGSIDSDGGGDKFSIGDKVFLTGKTGFFAGDKMILDSVPATLALTEAEINADDLKSNWYKVIEIDSKEKQLNITSASDFDDSLYKGIIAANTKNVYAQLSKTPDIYRISSVESSFSDTLSGINISTDVLASNISNIAFTENFGGSGTLAPYIEVGLTKLHVNEAKGYFILSQVEGKDIGHSTIDSQKYVSLNSNASEISLDGGSIVAGSDQRIITSQYTLASYTGGTDGIIIYNSGGEVSLGGLSAGESFFLNNKDNTGGHYKMTNIGLTKVDADGNSHLLMDPDGSTRLTYSPDNARGLDVSRIFEATVYTSPIDVVNEYISLPYNGAVGDPTIISYKDSAIASLESKDGITYTLSTDAENSRNLEVGNWQGISLDTGTKLTLDTNFINGQESPLRIAGAKATYGIAETRYSSTDNISVTSDTSIIPYNSVSKVSLISGKFGINNNQQITLAGSNDLLVSNNNTAVVNVSADADGGATISNATVSSNTSRFTVGRGNFAANVTVTTDSNGKTYVNSSNQRPFSSGGEPSHVTINTDRRHSIEYKKYNGALTLVYDKDEGGAVYATDLDSGDSFSIKSNTINTNETTSSYNYYRMVGSKLTATLGATATTAAARNSAERRIWYRDGNSDISRTATVNLDDSEFKAFITSSNGEITIPANNISMMSADSELLVIGAGTNNTAEPDPSKVFGTLTRNQNEGSRKYYSLTKNPSTDTESLSAIHIIDNSIVEVEKYFNNINVNVIESSTKAGTTVYSSFQSMSEDDDFVVSLSGGLANVVGAKELLLNSGSLRADDSDQTIWAGDYSIASASEDDDPDDNGVIVQLTTLPGSKEQKTVIRDIHLGESFYVDGEKYTRTKIGLTRVSVSASGQAVGLHYANNENSYVEGAYDSLDDPLGVDVSALVSNMSVIAAPEYIDTEYGKKYVLEVGPRFKDNVAVVDDLEEPSIIEAQLSVNAAERTYTLSPNDTITTEWQGDGLDIVSLTGGNTTIDTALVKNQTIAALGSSAAFKVLDGDDKFALNGKSTRPTIDGATKIALYNGTIAASKNQTISLGQTGKNFITPTLKNDAIKISYDKDEDEAIIYAKAADRFTIKDKSYSVKSGNGMDIIVNKDDVTLTGLYADDEDVFIYDGITYSLKAAGLVKEQRVTVTTSDGKSTVTSVKSFWNYNDSHSVAGGSVAISDLVDSEDKYWNALQDITNDTATIYSSLGNTTFIDAANNVDGGFQKTYGSLLKNSTGSYTVTKTKDEGLITAVNIQSGVSDITFKVGEDYQRKAFSNVTLTAPSTRVRISGVKDDVDEYQVTLYSGALAGIMGLSGVTSASLISGSLKADSNIGVSVGGTYIQAGESTVVTLRGSTNVLNDATIAGLDRGESFAIDDSPYTLSAIGITNSKSQFLEDYIPSNAVKDESIVVSAITSEDANWRNLTAPVNHVLLINDREELDNAIIVDTMPNPGTRYAKITRNTSGGFSVELESITNSWPQTEIIEVDNTSVVFTNAFTNRTLRGTDSKSEFKVTGTNSSITVVDSADGASIMGVGTNKGSTRMRVAQTAGTISTSNVNQTINAGSYDISFVEGDSIKVALGGGSNASIAALNKDDVFTVYGKGTYTMASDTKLRKDDGNKQYQWKDAISESVIAISALEDDTIDHWRTIVTVKNDVLTLSSASILSGGESAQIIDVDDPDVVYGTLTKLSTGEYSLSKLDASNNTSLKSVTINKYDTLNMTTDFLNVTTLKAGTTTFYATKANGSVFSVNYGDDVTVDDATKLTLTNGTIRTSNSDQTITANDASNGYNINGIKFGSDNSITVIKNDNGVQVGALQTDEMFGIGNYTYTFTDVGVIRTNPSSTIMNIADDSGWNKSGLFTVGTAFDKEVITVADKELNLANQSKGAVAVDDLTRPTVRLAEIDTISGGFRVTSSKTDSVTSIYLGNRDLALRTGFDVSVRTGDGNHTFTINNDVYQATNNAPLTIQSGSGNNKSSLINGTVALTASLDSSSVRTSSNTIAATAGDGITVKAAGASAVTLTGLNTKDQFTVNNNVSYTVLGAGLMSGNKIWTQTLDSIVLDSNTVNGLFNEDANWKYALAVSDSVLSIPPSGYPSTVSSWIIISQDKGSKYGTLNKASDGGYSITTISGGIDWEDDIISIKETTLSMPASFHNKNIEGVRSKATFTVTDNSAADFSVTDGSGGASIKGATKISQSGGIITLTESEQTVTTATSTTHAISYVKNSSGNGINVIVDGGKASIGALNFKDNIDSFVVDNVTYEMYKLPSIGDSVIGSILKDDKYWTSTFISDDQILSIDDLQDGSNWGKRITISGGILTIDANTLGEDNSGMIFDVTDSSKVYGTLRRTDSGGYSLNDITKVTDLSGIVLTTEAQPVSLAAGYLDVPITAGKTIFKATAATDGFTVNYTNSSLGVDDATALTLIEGAWDLANVNQTLTANGQNIYLGAAGTVKASITSDGVNVTGIDNKETVIINGETYKINAGDGISVNLSNDSVATVNDITNEDSFKIADDTFIKKAAGFIKTTEANSSLWINDSANVSLGVEVEVLKGDDETNWATVAETGNNIVINKNSKGAVLIDSVTDLSKIYGTLELHDDGYALTGSHKNTLPAEISVEDTIAVIASDFVNLPIEASGASFIVNSVALGSEFSVDARDTNPVLGNAKEVSLISGTLADLTSVTTVRTNSTSLAAQSDTSKIDVGFDGSVITISELDDTDDFALGKNTYTYKSNVDKSIGVVRNGTALFVSDELKGELTDTLLTDTNTNYQTMFQSDGTTISLRPDVSGVFVDSADVNVSKIYATQTYKNKTYTFEQFEGADIIDASEMASGRNIVAEFDAKVLTPAKGTFTINDRPYNAVSELTVKTAKDNDSWVSTLSKGTIQLAENGWVDMTDVKNNVSVTGGNGIEVTANNGSYTLGELNKNDSFTIGDYKYTMKSDVAIVRADSNGNEKIYKYAITGGALAQDIIDDANYWNDFIALENSVLNLSSTVKGGTVISEDFTEMYANLVVKNANFDLTKIADGADITGIKNITLADENSTLTTDFATTVKTTTANSKTYTVNESSYTAKNSTLEIAATDNNTSTITKGTITLSNSPAISTTSNHTISGTVSEVVVESMTFTPSQGDTFTVDGENYTMNAPAVGLTKEDSSNKNYLWTKADVSSYVLPDNTAWSNMMSVKSGILDLTSDVSDGSTVILDEGATKRLATLVSGDNTYNLSTASGDNIPTIQVGNSTDNTLTVLTNFDSDVKTYEGVYKIRNNTYKGNDLTIRIKDGASKLYNGTVTLDQTQDYNSVSDLNDNKIEATGGSGINITATDGTLTTISDLNDNDAFKIGSKYYKVLGTQTLVQTNSTGETPSKLYEDVIPGGAIDYADVVNDDNFANFKELNSDGGLDLTTRLGAHGWSAIVVANNDLTSRVAKVIYTDADGDGKGEYELQTTANTSANLTSVSLGAGVQTLTSAISTTVKTSGTGNNTYAINGKIFAEQNELTIAIAEGSATLTNGSVTVNEGDNYSVTARRTDNEENLIKSTSGTMTVVVDDANDKITISGLKNSGKFDVDGTEYTKTTIGLLHNDSLDTSITDSVTTQNLNGGQKILTISGGALTLPPTSNITSEVLVVDVNDPTDSHYYGKLNLSGGTYSLTTDGNTKLSSIAINSTKAILGTEAAGVNINTNNSAVFNVTATSNFTINAASTDNPPTIGGAASIILSSGTIDAPIGVTISAGGNEIIPQNGTMTISNIAGTVKVSGLDKSDETFIANGVTYKVTQAGSKLFDMTNAAEPQEVTSGFENNTFTLSNNIDSMRIIAVDGTNLKLSDENLPAYVYNSLTNPTTKLATLTFEDNKKILTGESDAESGIQTVEIAANDDLTVTKFSPTVKSTGAGLVTVNNQKYLGTTAVTVAADSDGTTSKLYGGTITLNQSYSSATDSKDNVLERDSGLFYATATAGKFTELSDLNVEESFAYGGTSYAQSKLGLINRNTKTIETEIIAGTTGTTIDLTGLNKLTWDNYRAPIAHVLDISDLDATTYIYDEEEYPEEHFATFTIENDIKKLAGEADAESEITGVTIGARDSLSVDFVTKVNAPSGAITVNTHSYNGITDLVISSGGSTISKLYDGTIVLDYVNPSATDSKDNTLTRGEGSINATAVDGKFTVINDLDPTESFTYGGVSYTQSAQGLRKGTQIRPDLAGTTLELDKLNSAAWNNLLAPDEDGLLDISAFKDNANVYDSATDPTTQLADLKFADGKKTLTDYQNNAASKIITVEIDAGDNLTVDFNTQINLSESGTVTVNSNAFIGTTPLLIDSDGSTSTLTDGTVSLPNRNNYVTPTDNSTITYTASKGDGMTVQVEGGTVTIDGLDRDEAFKIGETTYTVSAVGPINSVGNLWKGNTFTDGITVAEINKAENWMPMRAIANDVLTVNAGTLSDSQEYILVNSTTEPTKVYGDLINTNGKYTLLKHSYTDNSNSDLTSINASGIQIEIAPGYVDVPLVANNSELVVTAVDDPNQSFTLDTTSDTPTLSANVTELKLNSGTILAALNQKVNIGDTSITPTTINGTMIIGTETISGIVEGDTFMLGDDIYRMTKIGLVNDTDKSLVTEGFVDGAFTFGEAFIETPLIAVNSAGALNLAQAVAGDSLVVNSLATPTDIYGTLNKNENIYTLNKQGTEDGIKSVTMPDATSTLTTDIAATINTPQSSNTFTVNVRPYAADDSVLVIESVVNSDGKSSTLTNGTVTLANKNAYVTTTGGTTVTYTTGISDSDTPVADDTDSDADTDVTIIDTDSDADTDSDSDSDADITIEDGNATAEGYGMTVSVNGNGTTETITFSDLDVDDTFTVANADGSKNYRISAVGLVNSDGELWKGSDYSEGLTLNAINTESNWIPMLLTTNDILSVEVETLTDGDEVILVDNIGNPTKIYGDLTKTDGSYNLTKTDNTNAELNTIRVSGVKIEITPDYISIPLAANNSEFSDITLLDETKGFTFDDTGDTPSLSSNVKSLTLNAGTILAAENQTVTTGNNTITPTTINGTMIIGTTTISGIVEGDSLTLGDKTYKMTPIGLVNEADKNLVTGGIDSGTLTFADIVETQLIEVSLSGVLDLTKAGAGDSIVVNSADNPTNIYGALNKNENTYTLNKRGTVDGIKSVTMPDANSTLTTDIAATINTPISSRTFTINRRDYAADNSELVIQSDGSTSTLTDGTISLANRNSTVTTTSGSTVTYTAENGDGMTVQARTSGSVLLDGLTLGDTFRVGDDSYRVTNLGFHNNDNYIWTSNANFRRGVTISNTGSDGINNASNWTRTVNVDDGALIVRADSFEDGETVIIVDSDFTKTFGTLSRAADTYTLNKSSDDEKLSSITVDDTKLTIDEDLTDVPIIADRATFTVTAAEPFTVDSTGDIVKVSEEATAIEISRGTVFATTKQTVTATADSGNTYAAAEGNGTFTVGGKDFAVVGNRDDMTFGMTNGVANSVSGLEKDAAVTIDGTTYNAPEDASTLRFNDDDGWYFDGYIPAGNKYNITIDGNGNVTVDPGVKFSAVVASGRTLPANGTLRLAADVNNVAVNVTNNGTRAIAINDKDGNPLVTNLGRVSNVTFDSAGVMVEKTSDVAGAIFTIDVGQSFETETATVTANTNDCEVGIGTDGTSLSVDKAAEINAPANTVLTLSDANYTANGVEFTSRGSAQASLISGGVKLDLVNSSPFIYDSTNLTGKDSATAQIDTSGRISLTSGASVTGSAGKALNLVGTITLDANTIEAATATNATAKANGLAVGEDDVTITGDDDGYKINIVEGKISGLENIGNTNGVTVDGLSNGTITTDKAGSFTTATRTFTAIGDASVTYGIENGKIAYVNDVDSIMSGDFSDGLEVNGGKIQITGERVSLRADTDNNREIIGMRPNSTLTTAEGVRKVTPTGAGKFTFGAHTFETNDRTILFDLTNSSVTGIESLESGNLIISQDETNLAVNNTNLSLTDIDSPVTLSISDSKIDSVYGLDGGITGLDNATVIGLSSATVNGKFFDIDGDVVNAIVDSGTVNNILDLDSGATVKSAPNVDLRTKSNGIYHFRDDFYNINDTVDGVVVFTTDGNSYVTNIGEFEGSINGTFDETNINDKPFSSSSSKVTVSNDGKDIIALSGLSNGDTIGGSLSLATYVMPKGTLTVNEQIFILAGDEDGVSISGDGKVILGLDRNASLTVAKGGDFSVNSDIFDNAKDGTTFIAGRDHVYIYDPNNRPINDTTPPDDIIDIIIGPADPGVINIGGDSAIDYIKNGDLNHPMNITIDNPDSQNVQEIDFSDSNYPKRVTLLGGDQNLKFNDEGKNAAYITPTSNGKKNIELGNGGDLVVNDSPYARVSVKTGTGADTIVNRNNASTTVDVKANGDAMLVPTSGRVTLQNYDSNNHAKVRTFEYADVTGAIKENEIKFGDGVMTLGDAVVVFDPDAKEKGGTFANLVDYSGDEYRVGFTHTDGGVLNASAYGGDVILKGNYAEKASDTQKSAGSTLIGGRGDDTILAGEGDYVRAGAGDNQIYITDENLRGADGATIVLGDRGRNTIHNFNDGYDTGDAILVRDLSAVKFSYETEDGEAGLVMRSGNARITFEGLVPAEQLVTYDDANTAAPYEIKLTDGRREYNVAIAQEDSDIGVEDFSEANVFYGNKNGSGLNFSEYSGSVEVNLIHSTGQLDGTDIQVFNINKLQAGEGNSSLIGKQGANNTLIAGTGDGSMWSASGRDLMVGNTSEEKDGSTMFYFMAGDGRDTITGFNYLTSATDYNSDIISLPGANIVTDVQVNGDDVILVINQSRNDYLRLQDAVGKDFRINDRVGKVDANGDFDNLADFYVTMARNATMKVGADIGDAQVWLDDRDNYANTNSHGIFYRGEIKYLDASTANGNSTLVGNDLDNVVLGGAGANSIWGGFGMSRDTLIGGTGHNTFFFGMENGNDIIQGVKDGDVIDLTTIGLEQIVASTVTASGTKIELTDGSSLEIQGNADVEYRVGDSIKYSANHSEGHWTEK